MKFTKAKATNFSSPSKSAPKPAKYTSAKPMFTGQMNLGNLAAKTAKGISSKAMKKSK